MKLSKPRSQADLLRLQHSQLTGFSSSEGHWSLLNCPQLPGQKPITNRKHRRALAAVHRKEQCND